jgi:5-methylcytosine-specific restriction enzyme subunit McrC
MFLEELALLIKKGIRSDYIKKEENLKFLKGKLKIEKQIKKNTVHKERFYVEYDEFNTNRIENRIIKTTLNFLYGKSELLLNKKKIIEFKFVFNGIKPIYDNNISFSKIKSGRQMRDYELVLRWCRVFLLKNSFSPYKGKEVAFALLFDMNMLFESYVGEYLVKRETIEDVKLQDTGHYLTYDDGRGRFGLRPDIVIERKGETIICDTKWKIIEREPIQGDMYQLYAYGTKYSNCKKLYLIYPYTGDTDILKYNYFETEGTLDLDVIYFDLHNNNFYNEEEITFLRP